MRILPKGMQLKRKITLNKQVKECKLNHNSINLLNPDSKYEYNFIGRWLPYFSVFHLCNTSSQSEAKPLRINA